MVDTDDHTVGSVILTLVAHILISGWLLMLLLGMFAGYMGMPGLAISWQASTGIWFMIRMCFMKLRFT